MAPPTAGGVTLVPFPFSDLSQSKLRPAVVLAAAGRDDYILCQVTSNPYADLLAVELSQASFASGSLQRTSYARPGKLFTAHVNLIRAQVGTHTSSLSCGRGARDPTPSARYLFVGLLSEQPG